MGHNSLVLLAQIQRPYKGSSKAILPSHLVLVRPRLFVVVAYEVVSVVIPISVRLGVVRRRDIVRFDLVPDLRLRLDARFACALSSCSSRGKLAIHSFAAPGVIRTSVPRHT